jgi:endonuclease IV
MGKSVEATAKEQLEVLEKIAMQFVPTLIPIFENMSKEQLVKITELHIDEIDENVRVSVCIDKAYLYAKCLVEAKEFEYEELLEHLKDIKPTTFN